MNEFKLPTYTEHLNESNEEILSKIAEDGKEGYFIIVVAVAPLVNITQFFTKDTILDSPFNISMVTNPKSIGNSNKNSVSVGPLEASG